MLQHPGKRRLQEEKDEPKYFCGIVILRLSDVSIPWQVLGYMCFSIKPAGQTYSCMVPLPPLPPSAAVAWDLPSCCTSSVLQHLAQGRTRGSVLPCPWRTEVSVRVLQEWKALDASPLLSLPSLSFLRTALHMLSCGECWGGLKGLGTAFVEVCWKVVYIQQ